MESIRTFVAIDVRAEKALLDKWHDLKNMLQNDSIKWVDEQSLHLTLFFLGDTPIYLVDGIGQKLELEISKVATFNIELRGFGTFGNPGSPKVFWVGIAKSEQLNHLKYIVNGAISNMGFEEQAGNFSPHFTLGRVKRIINSNKLINFISSNKSIAFQKAEVENVIFYQSILKPTGPVYKPLKYFKLLSL